MMMMMMMICAASYMLSISYNFNTSLFSGHSVCFGSSEWFLLFLWLLLSAVGCITEEYNIFLPASQICDACQQWSVHCPFIPWPYLRKISKRNSYCGTWHAHSISAFRSSPDASLGEIFLFQIKNTFTY